MARTGGPFHPIDLVRRLGARSEAGSENMPSIDVQHAPACAPPMMHSPSLSMPDTIAIPGYVQHTHGASEIGKLSAAAVVREYEAAARDIEAMGAELIERVRQCEAMTRDALAVTEEMKDTADRYRQEAKRLFLQIENCSLVTAEVRKTCADLKERIIYPGNARR
jgi:hypothetical protein